MKTLFKGYLMMGFGVCVWFGIAAYSGWKAPLSTNTGGSGSSTAGRHVGGFWGGGK